MKFAIVTTPRTGGTVFISMLYNLAKQWWGSKNNLYEYFTIIPLYKERWEIVNNVITSTSYVRAEKIQDEGGAEYYLEKMQRLEMLKNDSNYTLKIFPSDMTPEIQEFIYSNYTVIYLERRDKVSQILSFNNLLYKNKAHYDSSAPAIEKFSYTKKGTAVLLDMLEKYYQLKTSISGKTVVYEDFISAGANELALIKLLDLPRRGYTPLQWRNVPTPYADKPENLLINKQEWLDDLPLIESKLSEYELLY